MLNPRKRKIHGVLKNETLINKSILDKYMIFYSWEFKIASNILKESDYTKMVKLLIKSSQSRTGFNRITLAPVPNACVTRVVGSRPSTQITLRRVVQPSLST